MWSLWQSVLACDGCLFCSTTSALLSLCRLPICGLHVAACPPASAGGLYTASTCQVGLHHRPAGVRTRPSMPSMCTSEYGNAAPCEPLCALAMQC